MVKVSLDTSINIKLARKGEEKIDSITLIKDLINGGWNIINNNSISYLPIGDDGDYDWQENEMTLYDFLKIVKTKEENSEVIGTVIRWEDSEIGGSLLIYPNLEMTFSICINRKKVKLDNSEEITDINWYNERLIILLKSKNYIIESFSYEEC